MIWLVLIALILSIGNWIALWYLLKAVMIIAEETL